MHTVDFAPRQTDTAGRPAVRAALTRFASGGPFWNAGIGLGSSVILALAPEIDTLAERIARLPPRAASTRPMVGQYLIMVKTLSAAWSSHSRPALLRAMAALKHFGDNCAAQDAPLLATALLNMFNGRPDAGSAARLIDGLVRRLAAPADALAAIEGDFNSYLAQMASASADLETDTVLITQRLQGDHVEAFVLAQRVNMLQGKLNDARARRHAHWLQGPQDEPIRLEIVEHSAELSAVSRQLDHMRAAQAATMSEAAYLQSLLPSLSSFLAAVDRIGAGIRTASSATLTLQGDLAELRSALLAGPAKSAEAHTQLQAALPNWRRLAGAIARLPGAALP